MGFFDDFRRARANLTGAESVATLTYMEDFFHDGANWTQNTYHASNGTKCLVAAADYARVSPIDDAKYWLRQAINECTPGMTIEQFNDTRGSYGEVATVIQRAKQLAASARLPARRPVAALPAAAAAEILPPERGAVPAMIDVTPRPAESRPSVRPSILRELFQE